MSHRRKFHMNNINRVVDYYKYDKFYKFISIGLDKDLVDDITCGNYNLYLTHKIFLPAAKTIQNIQCLKNIQLYFRPHPDNIILLEKIRDCFYIKIAGISDTGSLRIIISIKPLHYDQTVTDAEKIKYYQVAYEQVVGHIMSLGFPRPKSITPEKDILSCVSPITSKLMINHIENYLEYPVVY